MQENFFDNFANQYDVYNNLVSLGTHHFVKAKCVRMLSFDKKQNILDLCCGTGDIARLLKKYSSAKVVGVDVSQEMLKIAKSKSNDIEYVLSNVEQLPFEDNQFDIVTVSFGLRNIKDKTSAIKEIARVLKNDGQFLHIDFGKPNNFAQKIFSFNAKLFAKMFLKNVPSKYFLNSIENYWTPNEFEQVMSEYGFVLNKKIEPIFGVISAQLFIKKFL